MTLPIQEPNRFRKDTWTHIPIATMRISFDMPLHPGQIKQWRGAVARTAGKNNDLFHNHKNGKSDQYHYRYPQIQYRVVNGKAHIWAMNDGVEALRNWLMKDQPCIDINGLSIPIKIIQLEEKEYHLRQTTTPHHYRLMNYLPFTPDNYRKWQALDNLTDRIALLEDLLNGHLAALTQSQGYDLPRDLDLRIVNIRSMRPVKVHNYQRIAFNLLFRCPLVLPEQIGLGRSISYGFGVCQATKKQG